MNKYTVKFVTELSKELEKQFNEEIANKLDHMTAKEVFMAGVNAVVLAVSITALVKELKDL